MTWIFIIVYWLSQSIFKKSFKCLIGDKYFIGKKLLMQFIGEAKVLSSELLNAWLATNTLLAKKLPIGDTFYWCSQSIVKWTFKFLIGDKHLIGEKYFIGEFLNIWKGIRGITIDASGDS